MDLLVSTTSSLVLRYVLSSVSTAYRFHKLIPIGLGIWEGISMHVLLQAMPASYDPYLAYLLRAAIDFFISRDISYVSIVTIWTALIVLAMDALGSEYFYHTRHQRIPKRPSRNIGSLHTTVHTTPIPIPPAAPVDIPRTRSARSLTFILPTASPSTVNSETPATSSTQQQTSTNNTPSEQPTTSSQSSISTVRDGSGSDDSLGYIFSSPIYIPETLHYDTNERPGNVSSTPITSLTLLQSPTNPRPLDSSSEHSRTYMHPFPLSNNFSPRPPPPPRLPIEQPIPQRPLVESPIHEAARGNFEPEELVLPVPVPAPMPALPPSSLAESHEHRSHDPEYVLPPQSEPIFIPPHEDALQTPVLHGQHYPPGELDADELLTPPQLRPASSVMVHRASVISEAPVSSLLLDVQSNTLVASTSNTTPVPIPPREAAGSPLSALDIHSPGPSSSALSIADSILSTSDPHLLFERAEKLRNRAWKEAKEKDRLEAELRQARSEGRTRDVFLLMGDIKDCRQRMESLHSRARRRYYTAKNNAGQGQGYEIDVHGLLVAEAIEATESAFREALRNGQDTLRVIVGKGNHSRDGQPKLRPAVYAAMKKHGFECSIDSRNPGVLVLSL
ncbi:hypothetical protein VNI00_011793 [Paramarasmius palmivorus]|uniref:Smr domain-containing protein n=1 Tax=Paramarasmius palmivorus TaxID=297713 RepID=A0AAW0C9Q5_9AGAR